MGRTSRLKSTDRAEAGLPGSANARTAVPTAASAKSGGKISGMSDRQTYMAGLEPAGTDSSTLPN
jgi:hypothetical protein